MVMEAGVPGSRRLPVTLYLQLLFDSGYSTFGWLFFGLGLILALTFVARCEALTSWKFSGPLSSTTGVVERLRDIQATENHQYNQQAADRLANVVSKFQSILPSELKDAVTGELAVLRKDTPPEPGELQEMVLYHPVHPARAALPMALAREISIDARGNLQGVHPFRGILACIIPLLVILGLALLSHFMLPR